MSRSVLILVGIFAIAAVLVHSICLLYFCATDGDTSPVCHLQECRLRPGRTNNGVQIGVCTDGTTRSILGAPIVDVEQYVYASPCALTSDMPLDASASYTYVSDGIPGISPRHPGLKPVRSGGSICTIGRLSVLLSGMILAILCRNYASTTSAMCACACGFVFGGCVVYATLVGATIVSCHAGACMPDICEADESVTKTAFRWYTARCAVYGNVEVFSVTRSSSFRASSCIFNYDGEWPTPPGTRSIALYEMDPRITIGADGVPQACVHVFTGHRD